MEQPFENCSDKVKEDIKRHADQLIFTTDPAVLPDGINVSDAPVSKVNLYGCNKAYRNVQDLDEDLTDLLTPCQ